MRKSITTLSALLICTAAIFCQDINDDFSDGDFSDNPAWTGDTEDFIINDDFELQLMADGGGESVLYLNAATADSTQWEFFIRQEFSPSSSNFARVIMRADNPNIGSDYNGYFLKIGGESGDSDAIEFYRKDGNSEALLLSGEDGDLAGDPSGGRFRVVVNDEGEWTLSADYAGGTDFSELGTAVDNTYSAGLYFGFHCTYTSTRSDKFFFDDISLGPLFVDEDPPILLSATALGATEVELVYSEPLDQTSAEDLANYTISNGIGQPIEAELQADQTHVLLTLPQPMESGTTYLLTASDVSDINGNISGEQETAFFYVEPSAGEFRQIVINEIFADPTPIVGLPDAEYLEIFNASDLYFDLENWTLVNTETERPLAPILFEPGQFLILCDADDQELFEDFGPVLGIESFTALSNSGDSLSLLNADGDIIDWVSYTDDWYNDPIKQEGGYSLELINPFTLCSGPENWSGSDNPTGGSPGAENSIFDDTPDTEAPVLEDYLVQSSTQIVLEFSEVMDENSLINGLYMWNQGITTLEVLPGSNLLTALITLSDPLQTGVNYQLSITGLTDCEGNLIQETSLEILIGEIPLFGELVLSEIMADPNPTQALPDAEYFELVNIGKRAIELSGLNLNDISFLSGQVLFPGEYLICVDDENAAFYPNAYVIDDLGPTYFTNSGRELILTNQLGERLDRVNYADTWYKDPDKTDGGFSLERKNLSEICRASENWSASEATEGGTPGEVNSNFTTDTDNTPPELRTALVEDSQSLRLLFSEPLDSTNIDGISLEFNPKLEVQTVENIAPEYSSIRVSLAEEILTGIVYTLNILNVNDCSGNISETSEEIQFGLPEPGVPGDVLINEVLFNPRTGGADFVEVVNVAQKVVSIQSWRLQNQDEVTDIVSEEPVSILPGQYLVLTRDQQNIYIEYPSAIRENFLEMDDTPAFNNGDGSVILLNEQLEIIDRFDYDESYHFELLNSVKGVSLERLSFTRSTNDPGNWLSASEQVGFATPGYLNSQYNPEGASGGFFELEREVFSPDNDGFQDVLLINYEMDRSGAVATVKIYDRRGRQVRELSNNLFLGTDGTITWDGITDSGTKARIGPHIVYIDVFTADGLTETKKIPCIVAGRLNN